MKHLFTLLIFIVYSTITYSQSGQKWALNGNSTSTGDFIGTTNAQPLSLRTNGLERFKIDASGNYFFNGLTGTTMALISLNPNGQAFRINFTGNATDVLLGNGTFGSFASMSGWSLQGSTLFTPYSLAIDAPTVPGYKVSINGNVLVGGKISATSMEVVELVYADTIKGQKALKIRESLCFEGYNSSDPTSKNAICAHGNDLFIMSGNNNYNTIFNYGNLGNVGIGINNPGYKLHVNGDIKTDGNIFTNKIAALSIKMERLLSTNDSIIAFGDSSIYVNYASNRLFWSDAATIGGTLVRGFGIGKSTQTNKQTIAYGNNSIAIGTGVQVASNATNSVVIGASPNLFSGVLINNIANSFMVGFNSDRPTLFVSTSSGNNTTGAVGIGTTFIPAGYKLAVEGRIIAEEIMVKLRGDWMDVVFEENYKLTPLKELEKYYKINKHLPGVPSANEIYKSCSFNLGEMSVIFLQKIEELTIYAVEQEKQIEVLNITVLTLEEKIALLEQRMKALELLIKN